MSVQSIFNRGAGEYFFSQRLFFLARKRHWVAHNRRSFSANPVSACGQFPVVLRKNNKYMHLSICLACWHIDCLRVWQRGGSSDRPPQFGGPVSRLPAPTPSCLYDREKGAGWVIPAPFSLLAGWTRTGRAGGNVGVDCWALKAYLIFRWRGRKKPLERPRMAT